jgi:DNA-binding transcriptional LysR family regulator
VPLTEKVGRKIYLTDFGQSIANTAETILKEADALRYKTKEYKGLLTGRLRISSASTGKYVIPFFLAGFIKQHSGIDLTLDVSNKTEVIKSLRNNEIDFALVSVLPDQFEINEEILLENKLFLIDNSEKPNAVRPLIYREEGSATRSAMDQHFGNRSKRKSIALTSNEAVKQAVIAGLGQSIIPLIGMKNEISEGQIVIIPSKGLPITTFWRLIWLKNKQLSPIAQAYLDYIKVQKHQIISQHFDWVNTILL